MGLDRNPKEVVDDPEPFIDRDPNTGLLEPTPEWVEWHLSKPLDDAQLADLTQKLTDYGDKAGLEELNCLITPTRFDHQRLLHLAKAKYGTRSDLKLIGY